MDPRKKALCKALDLSREAIREIESGYEEHSFNADGGEYLVLSDQEAEDRVKAYIRESVWAFNPDFLASYMPDGVDAEVIRLLQEKCEDANEALYNMLSDFDAMADDAVSCDGRGQFLAHYDFEELESDDFYIYRIN